MKNNKKIKVAVAISGGVDSSVSAFLLKKKGYDVVGVFMKNWEEDDTNKYCHSTIDFKDAYTICQFLNIKLYTVNFSYEYWNYVFQYFLDDLNMGFTPNPDVLCNKKIKFKIFLEYALDYLKADYIATGHYVNKLIVNDAYYLMRSLDIKKDQSYFLYSLNQYQLKKSIFPIGNLTKFQVRKIASKLGLITANKKNSVGICFIGKRNFKKFLVEYIPQKPGLIIDTNGLVVGKHIGIMFYTLGQRKGLGIGGRKNKNNKPWYVLDKDFKKNILIVTQEPNDIFYMACGFFIKKINWINPIDFYLKKKISVKIRYRQRDLPCLISNSNSHNKMKVTLFNPVPFITPGQSAVFYQDLICLGGGIIEKIIYKNYIKNNIING
ncbi:MAG: tRNA 2-thiouridine(34) synthase MnmA [Arsenophonus sp.]|nr:MAG: tRNA 2-thiouridine(34) synthase MnmA [Arsenophonus sp.]